MKTGSHPMKTRLRLFLDWGITFGEPYQMPEHGQRKVYYAGRQELEQAIQNRFWTGSERKEKGHLSREGRPGTQTGGPSSQKKQEVQEDHPLVTSFEFTKRPDDSPPPGGAGGRRLDLL